MRKALALAFSLLCSVTGFAQGGKMTFDGVESEYEILTDRRIGPGTKYTEYYFKDITYNHYSMRALVVEIDNTNEYVYQSAYMVGYDNPDEKYNHVYHQSANKEYEYKLQDNNFSTTGRRPIATVMGGGFTQDPDNALSVRWEVAGGLVCNGIMHYMPANNAVHYYVDGNGNVKIGVLKCNPTVETANAGKYKISNYNRLRSNSPEGITLFASGYGVNGKFKTADIQSAKTLGTEVLVTLDQKSSNVCSGTYTGKVEEILSGSEHQYGTDQVVLAAVGGEGEAWLKKLAVGEEVTLNLQYYDAQNVPVQLQSCVKAFAGYAVKEGIAQPSNMKGYPEDALCLSADGKKSFYIHLDNWSTDLVSNAPVSVYNQFIQQLPGVYEGILMDGGPSSEMYIRNSSYVGNSGEWVSQNTPRSIPAAIMVYSTAKQSSVATSADFADYSKNLNVGEEYTPNFFFFNKYGDIVNPSATTANKVVLSCEPADLGTFSADGKTFVPQKGGKGYLCVSFKDSQDKIAIDIADVVVLKAEPEKIVDAEPGEKHTVKLYKIGADGSATPIDNSLATWSTNSNSVVSSCDNGIIVLAKPGIAEVYADYNGARAVVYITVISSIGQIEATAPVSVSVVGDIVSVTANDSSVCSLSCQMYTVDGKLVVSESTNGGSLKMTRRDASSPVVIVLTIDGKKYIYKLI